VKPPEIIAHRLGNQRLLGKPFATPAEVVRHFAAMQAQDYYGSKWAVAQRCGASDAEVEERFNAGEILRTHLCRPTWHFVHAEDIRWVLQVTKDRVHQANAFMNRSMGVDAKLLKRGTDIIAKALVGGKHLDRDALMEHLQRARIDTSGFRSAHYMMYAELEGVVCSGPRVGKQFTYALLDERVPKSKAFSRDEALAELTRRYFNSRGPACLADFALWSGVTMAEAKKGMAMVAKEFARVTINDRDNWYPRDSKPLNVPASTVHLLPNYDEYGIGYKDRSAFYDPAQAQLSGSRGNPVFRHLVVVNGKMMGTWDRALKGKAVSVAASLFAPLPKKVHTVLAKTMKAYAKFLGVPLVQA
jgi:Winged helix DNA-binding domain